MTGTSVGPEMDQVMTPDFYDYAWLPPSAVRIEGDFITVRWSDGAELRGYVAWLLENAMGTGIDPATREALIDPADLDPDTRLIGAEIADDGALLVTFDRSPGSVAFHPGWLHHVAVGAHHPASWLPTPEPWVPATLSEPPTHDGPCVLADAAGLKGFLDDLVRWGLARLRSLPRQLDVAHRLAELIGPTRSTNFGDVWDVRADVALAGAADTNSTANTRLRLGPHTDLPTRETPPGFQVLHCLVNETGGGASTMADGLAVVRALEREHPEHYEALTTLRWVFFNRGPGLDHRWSAPLIDLGAPGSPVTLRAFYPVRGFPDMAPEDMPRAYRALTAFSRLAAADRFQLRFSLEPGDLVAFDNRRILHGRDAFESGGRRHLRGLYLDHDEVLSATRVAARRRAATTHT